MMHPERAKSPRPTGSVSAFATLVAISALLSARTEAAALELVGRDLEIALEGTFVAEDFSSCDWKDSGEGSIDDFLAWANSAEVRPVGEVATCELNLRSRADGVRYSGRVDLDGVAGTTTQLCDTWNAGQVFPRIRVEPVDFSSEDFYVARRENVQNCTWQVQLDDGSTLVGGTMARKISSQLDGAEIGPCVAFPGETCVFGRLAGDVVVASGTGRFEGAIGSGRGELVYEWPLDPTRAPRQAISFTATIGEERDETGTAAPAILQPGRRASQPSVGSTARVLVASAPGRSVRVEARAGRRRAIVGRGTAGPDGSALLEIPASRIRAAVGETARKVRLVAWTTSVGPDGETIRTRAAGVRVDLRGN